MELSETFGLNTTLHRLEQRSIELLASLAAAEQAGLDTRSARQAHLIEGDAGDTGRTLKLEAECRDAADREHALREAVTGIATMIDETRAKLLNLEDAERRGKITSQLAAEADAVDAAAKKLTKAVAGIAAAFAALRDAIPEHSAPVWDDHASYLPLTADGKASLILAEALASAVPEAFNLFRTPGERFHSPNGHLHGICRGSLRKNWETGRVEVVWSRDSSGRHPDALGAEAAADEFVSAGLRSQAQQIAAGDLPAELSALQSKRPDPQVPTPQAVAVYVQRHLTYEDRDGPVWIGRGPAQLPQPVAQVAVERNLAVEIDSEEGRSLMEAFEGVGISTAGFEMEDHEDTGVDMAGWRNAEVSRLSEATSPDKALTRPQAA
jgi:hypothetical protein